MVERVFARGGDNAALAHGAADALFPAIGVGDELARAGQHRATGRTEALGKIDPDRIEAARKLGRADAARDAGIEQPRAVHVREHAGRMGDIGNLAQRRQRPDRTATEIGRLFDLDQTLARRVRPVRPDLFAQLRGAVDAAGAGDRIEHHACQRCRPAAFEADDVRGRIADDFIARLAMHGQGDFVAHRAGRQIQGRFLAEQRGATLDQAVDAGVFVGALVADLGVCHDLAHRRGRPGLGIAEQVDHFLKCRRGGAQASQGPAPPASRCATIECDEKLP